jgi:GTPase SAR1 family protein
MATNLKKHISKLKGERYIASLIYGDPNCGKTSYIKKFIEEYPSMKILYLDILEELKNLEDKEDVLKFIPNKFREYILNLITDKSKDNIDAAIIDNIDIVLDLWSTSMKIEFMHIVLKMEKTIINTPLIFLVHTDSIYIEMENEESRNELPQIINYNKLEAI